MSLLARLFVIHEVDDAEAVHALAALWKNDTVAAACAVPVEPIPAPAANTLEGQAARVADALLLSQPEGPYRIVGWSEAGLLAYQVAVQLIGRDRAVAFVGFIGDSVCPRDQVPQPSPSLPVVMFTGVDGTSGRGNARAWASLLPASQLRAVAVTHGEGSAGMPALAHRLAAAISQGSDSPRDLQEIDYWAGLPIQAGLRGHDALFCIPGAGDSVTGFAGLAGALGRSWPVHGLQPRGMDGLLIPHATVEAAAEAYLRCISALPASEPIHLLGHSFGGWVAYEIAGRLAAANRPPASLTLVDSEAPCQGGVVGGEHSALEIFSQFVEILDMVANRSIGIDADALAAAGEAERLGMVHAAMVRAGLISARSRPESLNGAVRTFAAALRTDYVPLHPYNGPMRLVVVSDHLAGGPVREQREQTKVLGWRTLAPQMTCWKGPGNHMTILKPPQVAELAHWWLAGLRESAHQNEAPCRLPSPIEFQPVS